MGSCLATIDVMENNTGTPFLVLCNIKISFAPWEKWLLKGIVSSSKDLLRKSNVI